MGTPEFKVVFHTGDGRHIDYMEKLAECRCSKCQELSDAFWAWADSVDDHRMNANYIVSDEE